MATKKGNTKTKRTTPRERNYYAALTAIAAMRSLLDEHEQLLLALCAGQKATAKQKAVIAEYEARKGLDSSHEPSKVDPDASPEVQLCQLLAYGLFLITEMTYARYCINHDNCTPT
ncbi:MAG: hypothetical protein IH986_18685 [Planctomycetes bacterium]|nr:hypothetical protein [Planctomycetota bacterium]